MDKEDVVHIYKEIYSTIKKKERMPFAAQWMDLGDYHTSKSGRERQIPYDIVYMWDLKCNTNELTD